jgi:hypothetical protein
MILDSEAWMNIRRFRALHAAGATFAETAVSAAVTGARFVGIWLRTARNHASTSGTNG